MDMQAEMKAAVKLARSSGVRKGVLWKCPECGSRMLTDSGMPGPDYYCTGCGSQRIPDLVAVFKEG